MCWTLLERFKVVAAGVLVALLTLGCSRIPTVQQTTVPAREWQTVSPDRVGWSAERLQAARTYAERIGSAAAMVVVHGSVITSWGQIDRKLVIASARKSLLSTLIGRHVETGEIKLTSTLEQLGIDDNPPSLTAGEKQATVADLLTSRSGVYHVAELENLFFAGVRPRRESHAPGTFFYYNNWDFNVLGTIFEQQTGTRIGDALQREIAGPLQMQDFQPSDVEYVTTGKSVHPGYPIRMSARDMARFGLLYLRQGNWGGRQVVSREWVARSTARHATGIQFPLQANAAGIGGNAYGYMWWVENEGRLLACVELPPGTYAAEGDFANYILVVPAYDLVVVHRGSEGLPGGRQISDAQFGVLVRLLLDAAGVEQPSMRALGC